MQDRQQRLIGDALILVDRDQREALADGQKSYVAGTQALPVDANGSEAQKVERRSPKPEDAGSIPATLATTGSSNGRTAAFEAANVGSTPTPVAKFDKKAWMREYMRDHRRGILRRPKPTTKREKSDEQ